MPFHSYSGYEFSDTAIETYAPVATGVYGIYNGNLWIYIDEAQDIRARLYDHFCGKSDHSVRIMRKRPAYFIFERCDARSLPTRKAELIREYCPCCNLTDSHAVYRPGGLVDMPVLESQSRYMPGTRTQAPQMDETLFKLHRYRKTGLNEPATRKS
jgi:hypothetical protein